MPGSLQYCNGIKTFAIHLIISQMVDLNRVQKQIAAMIGSVISEATLLKYVIRLYQALEVWETSAIERLIKAPSLHVDETSLRVDKKHARKKERILLLSFFLQVAGLILMKRENK